MSAESLPHFSGKFIVIKTAVFGIGVAAPSTTAEPHFRGLGIEKLVGISSEKQMGKVSVNFLTVRTNLKVRLKVTDFVKKNFDTLRIILNHWISDIRSFDCSFGLFASLAAKMRSLELLVKNNDLTFD